MSLNLNLAAAARSIKNCDESTLSAGVCWREAWDRHAQCAPRSVAFGNLLVTR